MATFSEASNPVAPPEYLSPSLSDQILNNANDPNVHPFAPIPGSPTAGSPCDIPDTNQFDFFSVNNGPGSFVNVPIVLKTPRKTIFVMGNDQGGGIVAWLHFQPMSAPGGVPTNLDQCQAFEFGTLSGAQSTVGIVGTYIRFCKPITKFFLTQRDSGQPGSNTFFCATDDIDVSI